MTAHLPETFREFAEARGLAMPPELVVDGFAGGGGASEGIEAALRRLRDAGFLPPDHPGTVSVAINHDDAAIAMHAANHPGTLHMPHDIWRVNALRVTNGLPVGMMWASPDCRHHSKAKGGKPVSKSVRDLAWVVAYWAKQVRPRMIFLENVEEFRDWGPLLRVAEGAYKPDPARKGQTFDLWVSKFIRLGYRVELRQLRACDYGAPTIRKRLYIIMRCDGEPIVWPEPTHGDPKSAAVRSGTLKPWRIIADCIDWNERCPSILMSKDEAAAYTKATGIRIIRPLAAKTMARIAKGVKRYVLDAADPFLVTCNHGGDHYRGQSVHEPFVTVAKARDAHGVVVPHLQAYYGESDAGGADRSAPVDEPIRVIPTEPRHAAVQASIAPFVTFGQHGGASREATSPLHTVEASIKNTNQMAGAFLVPRYGERDGQAPRTRAIDEVGPVIVPTGNGGDLAAVFLAQQNGDPRGDGSDGARPGRPVDLPGATATTRATQAQPVAVFLAQNNTDVVGHDAREPGSTIVGKGSTQSVVAAHMVQLTGGDESAMPMDAPGATARAQGKHSAIVTLPLIAAYYGNEKDGQPIDAPVRTASTHDRFAIVQGDAVAPPLTAEQMHRARQVAAFLRQHDCWDEREFVTVTIRGVSYVVVDIGMRMLKARELARAQGFPEGYKLAAPYKGGVLTDTAQRHKIGNSVCPDVAEAIVAANYRPRFARWQPTARAA